MLDAFLPGMRALNKLDLRSNWGLAADVEELQQQYSHVTIDFKPQHIAASYFSDVESEEERAE
jgi:hypothetical protein